MKNRIIPILLGVGLLLAITLSGCQQTREDKGKPTPAFKVAKPAQATVTDYAEYTGRLVATDAVDVKARVTGFLEDPTGNFEEGGEVKEGQILFRIDPRPYQAQYNQAKAQISLYEAQRDLAVKNLDRALILKERTKGQGITKQEIDTYIAQKSQAEAAKTAAEASLEVYDLNLKFTKVTSPIDGVASRFNLKKGNLVMQDQTLLTTVVSMTKIYAYFDMDESTFLKFSQPSKTDQAPLQKDLTHVPVALKLPGETTYDKHKGAVDFVSPIVNPATGTILMRGEFDNVLQASNVPNPTKTKKSWLMRPGMFVSVRLQVGTAYPALLVIDRVIWSNMGKKYVYVVDADNKVQARPIVTGALQNNGQRVVLKGLKETDWVIISRLPEVTPQQSIQPLPQSKMPTLEGDDATPAVEKTDKGKGK